MRKNESGNRISVTAEGRCVEIAVRGKLTHEAYQVFVPVIERLLETRGKLRVLFVMEAFHGWTARALWDDIRFDLRHFSDIERLALVGDKWWEKGMSVICAPFTRADVRYFDLEDIEAARNWVSEDSAVPADTHSTEDRIASHLEEIASENGGRRFEARMALVRIGQPAVPALVDALGSDRRRVRWEASKTLAAIGGPEVLPALVQSLCDDTDIRWIAAEGLKSHGAAGVRAVLEGLRVHFDSVAMRRGAHHVLHDLQDPALYRIASPVLAALEFHMVPTHAATTAVEALKELEVDSGTAAEHHTFEPLPA